MMMGIDHPALAVADVEIVAAWCCDMLGYKVAWGEGAGARILQAPDGTLLEVMPQDPSPRPQRTTFTPGWSHLALRVDNLDAAIAALDAKGAQWAGAVGPAAGGGRLRSFVDPEGNLWQIVERPQSMLSPKGDAQ